MWCFRWVRDMMAGIISVGSLFLLVGYFIWQARRSARREEQGKAAQAILKRVEEAERIKAGLKTDPAERKRIEKKFTRRRK